MSKVKKRKKDEDIFDKLRTKTNEAKEIGSALGKVTKKEGGRIGKQLAEKGKAGIEKSRQEIEKGIEAAKKAQVSKTETLELIEKLAQMKESGILTETEFTQKKRELLKNI